MKKVISFLLVLSMMSCSSAVCASAIESTEETSVSTSETENTSEDNTFESTEDTTEATAETTEQESEETSETSFSSGDANKDSVIDAKDAVLILQEYANILVGKGGTNIDLVAYDANLDGEIDSKDATLDLIYYAYCLSHTEYSQDLQYFIGNEYIEYLAELKEQAEERAKKRAEELARTEYSRKYPDIKEIVVNTNSALGKTLDIDETESEVKSIINSKDAINYIRDKFKSSSYSALNKSNSDFVTDLYLAMGIDKNSSNASIYETALENGIPRDSIMNAALSDLNFKKFLTSHKLKTVVYDNADAALEKNGRTLQAAFNYTSSLKYKKMATDSTLGTEYFADYVFSNYRGNCYAMAAAFCEMARELGYEAHQVSGTVPLLAGGMGPHSWVEVVIDGTTYVCDPDFTEETGRNGFQITYGQSGTWRYNKGYYMS